MSDDVRNLVYMDEQGYLFADDAKNLVQMDGNTFQLADDCENHRCHMNCKM